MDMIHGNIFVTDADGSMPDAGAAADVPETGASCCG